MAGITSQDIAAALKNVADKMEANLEGLCKLDGEIGDADHGIAMATGFAAVRDAVDGLGDDPAPSDVLNSAARSFLNAVGASSGPLYATAFMRAAVSVKGKTELDDADVPGLVSAMADGIAHRGKAKPGDKTMLDAWLPASEAALAAAGQPAGAVLRAAATAAQSGAEGTRDMQARLGRAARLGERSLGHVDPGAASAALVLEALADSFE